MNNGVHIGGYKTPEEARLSFVEVNAIGIVLVLTIGTFAGFYAISHTGKEITKPNERPRIEYRDVNRDGREDIIIYSGGREYLFLQGHDREYTLGNLEDSVQELNKTGEK
ncbi:hypothetical protein HYT25_04945 [Candidatus Pacearchaeota archaeon]|nr:hypothetical protein [Candidatus Pacearchaeota archaeon]